MVCVMEGRGGGMNSLRYDRHAFFVMSMGCLGRMGCAAYGLCRLTDRPFSNPFSKFISSPVLSFHLPFSKF